MRCVVLLSTALVLSATGCAPSEPEAGRAPTSTPTTAVDTSGTEPGTELSYGESATLVWQPSSSVTGELELSVDAVAEQDQSVFDGWVRDDAMAASRPYFVTVTLRNAGESDLAGQAVPLYLRDDAGTLGAPWTLGGDFAVCQSGPLPSPFAAGAEAEMCLVYLVPGGARVEDMVFQPTEGFDPISWTGDVARPRKPKPAKGKDRVRSRG